MCSIGTLDQDELLIRTGTQIAITAAPSTQGGVLLSSISVAIPNFLLGDTNLDSNIDLLDIAPFVDLIISGGYQLESDINQDGAVDLLDIAPFVQLLTGG